MVDNFALLISHGLMAIAVWRLLLRDDLDHEDSPEPDKEPAGFHAKPRTQKISETLAGGADA